MLRRFADFRKHAHVCFAILFSLLLLTVFIRYVFNIDIPKVAFLGIIFAIAMLGDKTEIVTMCMCCIPLHSTIDFYYAIVICIALYALKNYRAIKIRPVFALLLVMIVWELLHSLAYKIELPELLSIFVPIIALAVIMCSDVSDVDYCFLSRTLALATVFVCCVLLGKELFAANFDFAVAIIRLKRLGLSTSGASANYGEINPNTLGIICIIASGGLLQLRIAKKKRTIDLLFVVILMMFGVLTSSRTFIVCAVLMLLLFLFGSKGGLMRKVRYLTACITLLAVGILVMNIAFPGQLDYFLSRFQSADLFNGRLDLMAEYHSFIFSSLSILLCGVGCQNFSARLLDGYHVAFDVPHNCVQEIVVAWGLLGLLMLMLLIAMMLLYSRQHTQRRSLIHFVPLIIIITKSMVGQMLTSGYTMLALTLAYLSLCQNFDGKMADSVSADNS